ncbi:TonB-dependent receptor [Sphingomonas solaris]|uniref:TonB-dependent receptor plug domain-containing protein n=1 Tax=Alterirhizorhabdus solaris TaxID=2529389 RepID=A0A558R5V1_9SPHN|nr:TonB-dependent receptor plug domain-containing protein [Sphingomonas solaris]TVV74759.1 hypothetical protein FOY91_08895 [Sphingomonas solaris]
MKALSHRLSRSQALKAGCLASVAMLSLSASGAAFAQVAEAPVAGAPGDTADVAAANTEQQNSANASDSGEILVTARREAENLQDVPVSIQVVTGDRLQKLAITSVEEVSKLAPGLTLVNAGSSTSVTLRGVTWQPGSGTPATPIYFNEVPFDPGNTIVSLFDVGQIEVLRGPQGTTRGAPSISGAVTISTRKPDLDEFGGYIQGLYGQGDHTDFQGAINVPVIKDVLAFRFAANIEDSDATRIYSVQPGAPDPKLRDRTYRATVLFKPTDTLSLQAMYQRRKTLSLLYSQVAGPGSPGRAAVRGFSPLQPAGFNGPALDANDRRSVQDLPSNLPQHLDLLTVNASWEVAGHTLSYNYGRQFNRSGPNFNATDTLNALPGFETGTIPDATPGGVPLFRTHEIRISSLQDENRPFEYDIGWFSRRSGTTGTFTNFNSPTYLTGAFGNPILDGPGAVTTPNPRYVLNSSTNINISQVFDSFYGNLKFHIDERTELTGGVAILRDRTAVSQDIRTFAAFQAVVDPRLPSRLACPAVAPGAIASPVYTSGVVCEVPIPDGFRNARQADNNKNTDSIYNISLSHKFTDDFLAYATHGTSFRTGFPAVNNFGLPNSLVSPDPETAKSYEIGAKAEFGRRLRISAAIFQLDYKGQLTTFEGVPFFSSTSLRVARTNLAFFRNVDARVRGAEVEIAARPIDGLSLGANFSYSKIKSQGGAGPCDNGTVTAANPNGDLSTANPVDFCPIAKGVVLNTQAPFQATFNGGYEVAVTDYLGGYVRFNVSYQGKNPNFGNFPTTVGATRTFRKVGDYAIVDLFAGLTGDKSGWEIGAYAKNVFDKVVEQSRLRAVNVYPNFAAATGYDVVRTTRPREIGVTARYAFGSK